MSCSIIIPTYNRKRFEILIEENIKRQLYNNIIEVLIGDDGDEKEALSLNIPYPVEYIRCPRMTIGEKRNLLVSKAKGEFIAHMDTDDIYLPAYIQSSIDKMIKYNKDVSGTSDMLFIFVDGSTNAMKNPLLSMANEATLVYRKSFWEEKPFNTSQTSEAIPFLKGRHWQIIHNEIEHIMICLCHKENTVNKNRWKEQNKVSFKIMDYYKPILKKLGFCCDFI